MFEEVKEMIDATVYPNGNGEVTAQNINLAMQGIVEATEEKIAEVEEKVAEIEENGTGGSGALKVWYWNEEEGIIPTEEQIAENIATYNALMGGTITSVIVCDTIASPEANFESTAIMNMDVQTIKTGEVEYVILQGVLPGEPGTNAVQTLMIQFNADGTMYAYYGEDQPSEGGSAIAYVNIPMEGELTEEQIAENAEAYSKIASGEAIMMLTYVDEVGKNIVPPDLFVYDETTIAFVATQHNSYYIGTTISKVQHVDIVGFLDNTGVVDVYITEEDESSTSASNGPLRVWINEVMGGENTPEQIEENIATFRAMWGEKPQQAIFSGVMGLGGYPMMIAKPVEAYRLISEDGVNMISMTYRDIVDQGNGLESMEIYVYLNEDGTVAIQYES